MYSHSAATEKGSSKPGAGLGARLKSNWQLWLGLGVSLLFLLYLVFQVDLDETRDALGRADYMLVIPAISLYFVAVFFRAFRWRFLLSPLGSFELSRLYPVVIIGYMANNLLPVRLGELVRSYYLAQREQVSASSTLATVAVERVYDGVTLLAFTVLAGLALLLLGEFVGAGEISGARAIILATLTVLGFLGTLVFLTISSTVPRFVEIFDRWLAIIPLRIRPQARGLYHTFVQGLTILNSPRRHLELFVLSLPVWLMEGTVYFLIGYSFGIDSIFGSVWVFILVVALVTATSNLATSIPSAIGGIGPFEVVVLETLLAVGVDKEVATAYAIFVHLVALWLPVNLVGLGLLWRHNASLRQLVQPPAAGGPDQEPARRFAASVPQPKDELP